MVGVQGRSGCAYGGGAARQRCSQTENQQDRASHEHQAEEQRAGWFRRGSCGRGEVYAFPN
jgi:hypothetical protein